MAALLKPADNSELHVTPSKESPKQDFMPKDTLDQPCDVILVVEDGKQIKTHRQVLSEASPFFEKMLSSDMKESKEGMVRLEMFSESVMGNALEFIYTGSVQILDEDSARDLIVIADYLFLHNLKTLAEGALVQKLNTSNCISTYYFSQRYQCEELFSKTKKFILANFSAVYAANPEEVLNMSSKEIEMWISSDEIDVSAEEDVFNIILSWIDLDKRKRNKYFVELFRQVRLVYVSHDFLSSDIVTNDLVKDNEGCLDLVKDAMRLIQIAQLIGSKHFGNLSVAPRKSLETPVIAIPDVHSSEIRCYFPREGRLCSLPIQPLFPVVLDLDFVSCRDKLYSILRASRRQLFRQRETPPVLLNINLYSKSWISLSYEGKRKLKQIFVGNEDELYAFVYEPCDECASGRYMYILRCNKHVSFILKYKPESNLWEDISSFDSYLALRRNICILAKDNFIYFIGGHVHVAGKDTYSTDVDRYDLSMNQWIKVAHMGEARSSASGAVVNGKIFVTGGTYQINQGMYCECEVYNETTNEWQFISSLADKKPLFADIYNYKCPKLLSVDGKLYAIYVMSTIGAYNSRSYQIKLDCYDPDKNDWNHIIEIPVSSKSPVIACSMRIFKDFLSTH